MKIFENVMLQFKKEDMHLLGDILLNMCKEIEIFKAPFN